MRKLLSAVITMAAVQTPVPAASAADEACCLRITPYMWAIGIDGDINANGTETSVSADFSDVIDNLDFGGSVLMELNKGRWVSYAMVDYMALNTDDVQTRIPGVDAEFDFDSTLATFATGYRFQTGERSTLDMQVGVRYAQFDAEASLQGIGQRDADNNIYDAIIALRPRLALSKYWYFSPAMSIGAGDSDLTWELAPQLVYECCGWDVRFGYRKLNYDFEKGNDSMDLSIHGPMIGAGLSF